MAHHVEVMYIYRSLSICIAIQSCGKRTLTNCDKHGKCACRANLAHSVVRILYVAIVR